MTDRTMELVNADEFGALIVEWANTPSKRPKTIAEFKELVPITALVLGSGYLPDEEINFVDLPSNSQNLNIVIPHKDDLAAPLPPGGYPLLPFYQALAFHVIPHITDHDKFRLCRIADYSTGKCQ